MVPNPHKMPQNEATHAQIISKFCRASHLCKKHQCCDFRRSNLHFKFLYCFQKDACATGTSGSLTKKLNRNWKVEQYARKSAKNEGSILKTVGEEAFWINDDEDDEWRHLLTGWWRFWCYLFSTNLLNNWCKYCMCSLNSFGDIPIQSTYFCSSPLTRRKNKSKLDWYFRDGSMSLRLSWYRCYSVWADSAFRRAYFRVKMNGY